MIIKFMSGYFMLCQFNSSKFRLSLENSDKVSLCQVRSG
jgi:hypothetical protein